MRRFPAIRAVAVAILAAASSASGLAQERETRPPAGQRQRATLAEADRDRLALRTVDVVQGETATLQLGELAALGEHFSYRIVRLPCSPALVAGAPQVEATLTAELVTPRRIGRRTEPVPSLPTLAIRAAVGAEAGRYARLQGANAAGVWSTLPVCIRVVEAKAEPARAGRTAPRESPAASSPAAPRAGGTCPDDYFTAAEIAAAQPVRFRFPIPDPVPEIVPEPGVIHMDRNRSGGASKIDCVPYQAGHLCYDNHEGTDFMLSGHVVTMSGGVRVVAAADGVVQQTVDGNPDLCTWVPPDQIRCLKPNDPWNFDETPANHVELCHADGTRSRYYHLQNGSVRVKVGQRVACGDVLGNIGSSGHSSSPHLHFDVRKQSDSGDWAWVDPYAPIDGNSLWTAQNGGGVASVPGPQCQ